MRQKMELEAWWKQTGRDAVALTRANVRTEFVKMWIERRKERIAKRRIERKKSSSRMKGNGKSGSSGASGGDGKSDSSGASGKIVKKWGGKEAKFREEMWNWERDRRREARIHKQSFTWSQKELRQKVEVEAWLEKTQQKGITITRKNVKSEYMRMWAWIRSQRQEQRKARAANRWTWNELRLKSEINAWRIFKNENGPKLTRANVVAEYEKMWPKKREYLKTQMTAEEEVMKKAVEQWRSQTKQIGKTLNRVNVKSEYLNMWKSMKAAMKTDMTVVQVQKEFFYKAWFEQKTPEGTLPEISSSNIDDLYAKAVAAGLQGMIIEP